MPKRLEKRLAPPSPGYSRLDARWRVAEENPPSETLILTWLIIGHQSHADQKIERGVWFEASGCFPARCCGYLYNNRIYIIDEDCC
jgi:hypothetical protein